jgi:hypothetical protein
MHYRDQWKIIASRIQGLMRATELHARFLAVRSSDSYGRTKSLREHGEQIFSELSTFAGRFRDALPPAAVSRIEEFVNEKAPLLRATDSSPDTREELAWAGLVMLGAFETEVSFLLADQQQVIRSRSELAFAHLQRWIVVDEAFRKKWQDAFAAGETACEGLGAVHLLSHGIWAFKLNAAGGRTDLVYAEPLGDFATGHRYADGLVLTEWKKAAKAKEAARKFEEARDQARRYAQGVLAGNELTSHRYAVVVSGEQVDVPDDLDQGSIVYRHISIAVEPRPPSKPSTGRDGKRPRSSTG